MATNEEKEAIRELSIIWLEKKLNEKGLSLGDYEMTVFLINDEYEGIKGRFLMNGDLGSRLRVLKGLTEYLSDAEEVDQKDFFEKREALSVEALESDSGDSRGGNEDLYTLTEKFLEKRDEFISEVDSYEKALREGSYESEKAKDVLEHKLDVSMLRLESLEISLVRVYELLKHLEIVITLAIKGVPFTESAILSEPSLTERFLEGAKEEQLKKVKSVVLLLENSSIDFDSE